MSHDFRSPLTSIKGYAEAIADGTIPPEMQQKYFNIILFEVERLTKLTGNLLELNQFEQDGLVLELADFDINHAIKDSSAAFEQRCTEKKISLNLIFSDKELFVNADINKIQQVIQNLLDNAIEASEKLKIPGNISLTIRRINHFLLIKVSNACEENKESFAHFPSTTKKNREFHGWGLPSVKDAVEKYNGTLKCINEEKQFIVKIMLFFEKNTN